MVRLDKYLADAGIGTRSEVKNYIKHKWITVDGMVAQKPEQKIDPGKAHICFQGEHVVYVLFPQALRLRDSPFRQPGEDGNGLFRVRKSEGVISGRASG